MSARSQLDLLLFGRTGHSDALPTGDQASEKMVEHPEPTGLALGVLLGTEVQRYIFLQVTHQAVRRQNVFTPRIREQPPICAQHKCARALCGVTVDNGQALIRCCGSGWAGAAGPGSSGGLFRPEFRHRVRVGPGQDRPRRENLGRRRHAGRAELAAPTGRARGHQPAARLQQAAASRGDSRRRFILSHDRAR